MRGMRAILLALISLPSLALAEPLTLERAVELALQADPRIREREAVVEQARALLDEVKGHGGLSLSSNLYLSAVEAVKGGFFKEGTLEPRSDAGEFKNGLSPLVGLQLALIKPLYTFGKIEHYSAAAEGNISVKQGEVKVARAQTQMDVRRAWYGLLTARESRAFLEDLDKRVDGAIESFDRRAANGTPPRQADRFALEAVKGLVGRYLAQARAIEQVSLDGLKTLIGLPLSATLELADARVEPVDLPEGSLDEMVKKALAQRAEMEQVEAGMAALREMVEARRAETRPDLYAAVVGDVAWAARRDRLDNPYLSDPFNHAYAVPVVGMRWNWQPGVQDARTRQAEAELRAVTEKANLARMGIPFQVAEAYHRARGMQAGLDQLKSGYQSARRWMVANFIDMEAGSATMDQVVEAFKTYATMYGDYLLGVNDYNMQVAALRQALGEWHQ
ncbi:TolC family protein [Thiofaba sp. EF100]|uniref:TolC family protein n=1 Tax=Thiofaba sp. EF100 TaxID=3121274 RepID=UPI003222027B